MFLNIDGFYCFDYFIHILSLCVQLSQDCFLEDLSLLLNTGELPGMFSQEETKLIHEKLQVAAKEEVRKINFLNIK